MSLASPAQESLGQWPDRPVRTPELKDKRYSSDRVGRDCGQGSKQAWLHLPDISVRFPICDAGWSGRPRFIGQETEAL